MYKPRFNSTAAALRFYFRAREVVEAANSDQQRFRDPPLGARGGGTIIDDFLGVEACLDQLGDFARWMLSELYGPTCFAANQRSVVRAWEEARRRVPDHQVSREAVKRLHQQSIELLDRRLAQLKLIAIGARAGGHAYKARDARGECIRGRLGSGAH